MEQEIPEVRDGVVEIKSIAREPGARSKASVVATVPGVDPVGSCVGMRGLRIQNIVNELANEKIDVIDELNICSIGKYAVVDMGAKELELSGAVAKAGPDLLYNRIAFDKSGSQPGKAYTFSSSPISPGNWA